MRAFIDTSSLVKKYIEETGSEEFGILLKSLSEIVVSPITVLELHSAIERRLREGALQSSDAKWIEKEFTTDYDFFGVVEWNDELVKEGLRIIRAYQLRVLDAIQLSAALISDSGLLVTSDKRLYQAARKVMSKTRFI
ncbi:MAG: PIN domain-containing protein [Chitinivibrionales bacterium]|nr:PIN domain-containing protein [Chitinivibrionales bacterium]MBD3395079.1 PIN domain-containing protein [Chitinivibrionales bacterium]